MSSARIPYEIVQVEKNKDSRKTLFSTWHVVVNSNVKAETLQTANDISDILKDSVVNAFKDRGSEVFVVKRPGDSFDSDAIEKIKISQAAEIGEDAKGGRVHVHAMVEVEHHTILQIDMPTASKIIKEYCESRSDIIMGVYVDIKWIPMSKKPLEHYLGKNPLTRENPDFQSKMLGNS